MYALILLTLFWRPSTTDKAVDYLIQPSECRNGICTGELTLGGYNHDQKVYRSWDGRKWGEIAKPPIEPRKLPTKNFGIVPNQPSKAYSRNGREITQREAEAAVLRDDSNLPFLTIIDKDYEKILPQLTQLSTSTRIQGYPPGHWAVKNLEPLGKVIYQDPSGKVLYKSPEFSSVDAILEGMKPAAVAPVGILSVLFGAILFYFWRRTRAVA